MMIFRMFIAIAVFILSGIAHGQVPGAMRTLSRASEASVQSGQGTIERHTNVIIDRWDGNIIVDESSDTYFPSVNLQADVTPPPQSPLRYPLPSAPVNLRTSLNVQESPEQSLKYQFGAGTAEQVITIAVPVISEIVSFSQRQEHLEAQRESIRSQFNEIEKTNRAQYESLMEQARAIRDQEVTPTTSNADFAQAIANLGSGKSDIERAALAQAKAIAADDFRFNQYDYDANVKQGLEKQLEASVQENDFFKAAELLEMLTYGKVNNRRVNSKVANSYKNKNGLLKVPTGGALQDINLSTTEQSELGQVVRRVANEFQATWQETNGLSGLSEDSRARFTMGIAAITLGDNLVADGFLEKGTALIRLAKTLNDSVSGFSSGVATGITAIANAIPELARLGEAGVTKLFTDPNGAWESTANFVMNLDEVGGAMIAAVAQDWELLSQGNAFQRAEVIGRYSVELAIGFVTGGTGAIASRGSTLTAKLSQSAIRMKQVVGTQFNRAASSAMDRGKRILSQMPAGARRTFAQSMRDPKLATEYSTQVMRHESLGNKATSLYIQRVSTSKGLGIVRGEVQKIADFHSQVYKSLDKVEGIRLETNLNRAIDKRYVNPGRDVDAQVFVDHPSMLSNDHRMTIGGEMGHKGLYASEGALDDALKNTLALETGIPVNDLAFGQMRVSVDRVLDITDQRTLDLLGFDKERLVLIEDDKTYKFSQALGDAAKAKGFNGIRFESIQTTGVINVVIFK